MSSAAIAAGGGISAGSAVAVAQSIGAVGVLPPVISIPVIVGAIGVGIAVPVTYDQMFSQRAA